MFYKVGLTGNYYFTSGDINKLKEVCIKINKSIHSIYWSDKYQVYAIRIKSKITKDLIKKLYAKTQIS